MSGSEPLVSIVLPTYNRAGTLPRSIGSVLRQSCRDFELLVIDDGSTDNTRETVATFGDSRVRYVARAANGGVAAARNTGVRAARGRYLAFQDSDDEWLPEKLERQVAALAPLDETSMSICGVQRTLRMDPGAGALAYPRTFSDWRHGLDWRGVLQSGLAYTQSWLVPRQAVLDAGLFDERLGVWEDWDLLMRLSRQLPIRPLPEPLVISERLPGGLSADPYRFLQALPLIVEKQAAAVKDHADLQAALQFLWAVQFCKVVRLREARRLLWQGLRRHPLHGPSWRLLARTLLGPAHIRRRFGAPPAQGDEGPARLDLILTALDRVLQRCVPTVANRISYVSFPDYTDNAFYVFQHALRTRSSLEHVWLVRDIGLRGRIERDFAQAVAAAGTTGNTLRVERRASAAGYWRFLRSRYVFHTHGAYRFRDSAWRRTVVCLWHGMPIKCVGLLNRISPNPYPTFGTTHLATSHFFKDIIARAFAVADDAVKLCSLPRCDALRHEASRQLQRAPVRERLGLGAGQALVLWLPTFRAEGALARRVQPRSFLDDLPAGALEALDRAAQANDAVVLVKLHPADPLNGDSAPWPARHVRLLRAAEWAATGIQLYDLLAACDGLVSDVSSVLIDYLLTGRPIGILGFDPATYTRELAFPFDRLLATGRYDVLGDAAAIDAFVQRVRHGERADGGATFLYDDFALPGSEQALRDAGL